MCRNATQCSEIDSNSKTWDADCPLRTPDWMQNAVDEFVRAVHEYREGNTSACIARLQQIDGDAITTWYIEHGQMSGKFRTALRAVPAPPDVPLALRDPLRSPKQLQCAVFERDGYHCRYCGNRLIDQTFMKQFVTDLRSDSFTKGTTNLTSHGIIHLTWPVADHVIPWNKGGRTSLDNLVASCAPCNYGKAGYTIEQLGITNPFSRPPIVDEWDGLVHVELP